MDHEIQKISVRIGGMSYNLVSGESEAYTRQIAARADEMIRRVTVSSPHLSQQMTTVLALVNAVDELNRQAAQQSLSEQQRDAAELKNAELRAELAKVRELNWEMKKEILRLSALVRQQEQLHSRSDEPRDPHPAATGSPAAAVQEAAVAQNTPAAREPAAAQGAAAAATDGLDASDASDDADIADADDSATFDAVPADSATADVSDDVDNTDSATAAVSNDVDNTDSDTADVSDDANIADADSEASLPAAADSEAVVAAAAAAGSSGARAAVQTWADADRFDPLLEEEPNRFEKDLPRPLTQLRQTGLDEYLASYGRAQSVVEDLGSADEP